MVTPSAAESERLNARHPWPERSLPGLGCSDERAPVDVIRRYCRLVSERTVDLLGLGAPGTSLSVVATRRESVGPTDDPWFDVAISVEALPFTGTIKTIFTLAELREWADSLRSPANLPRRVVLGGDRAAELLIDIEHQIGGAEDALALEVSVTPSGDDPDPYLRYLIFNASPFWNEAAAKIDALS